jgi:hypothetical protein
VDTKDVDKLVETIALISKSFGGIIWRTLPLRAASRSNGGSRNAATFLFSMTINTAPLLL